MSKIWDWITGGVNFGLVGLAALIPAMVAKVFLAFGVTIVTMRGLLPDLKQFVLQFVSGMPAEALDMLGALGVGTAMSMVFSALIVRMSMKMFFIPTSMANAIKGGGLPG